jgi:hypothetical protein
LLGDAAFRLRIATAARHLMEARFSWATVAARFEAICLSVLEQRLGSQ